MADRVTRVLICDDSALMRKLLSELLSSDPGMEVIGTASDPLIARQMIKTHNPDVLTLDVEMPRMDGLAFLEKIMTLRPMPVVMVSSLTQSGADATLRALEMGAVDYVAKPLVDLQSGMRDLRADLINKVRAASRARVRGLTPRQPSKLTGAAATFKGSEKIVAVGASTGGVEALKELICALPANAPATVVTQHMPEKFTASFAKRLDGLAAMSVCEAQQDQRVLPGHVYIAPGSMHLELVRSGADYRCHLSDGPPVSGHRPSVDVLFRSVAKSAGANAVGVILTGMGRDGSEGLLAMREAGAYTIGEDESTCVVYGMPKAAKALGAVATELPLGKIAEEVLRVAAADGRALRI